MTGLHSPETTQEATADLGTTAARAVLWNYVSFASGKVLVLVTLAVLARLLTPAEFGHRRVRHPGTRLPRRAQGPRPGRGAHPAARRHRRSGPDRVHAQSGDGRPLLTG